MVYSSHSAIGHHIEGGMTKIFETAKDLENEQDVVSVLSAEWGFDFVKLDRRYQADFMGLLGDQLKLWVEIKCRNIAHDKYPTIILELDKALAMWNLAKTSGSPSIFVARWTDKLGWIKIAPPFRVTYTGKNDRYGMIGSPCVMLPIKHFVFLEMQNEGFNK